MFVVHCRDVISGPAADGTRAPTPFNWIDLLLVPGEHAEGNPFTGAAVRAVCEQNRHVETLRRAWGGAPYHQPPQVRQPGGDAGPEQTPTAATDNGRRDGGG